MKVKKLVSGYWSPLGGSLHQRIHADHRYRSLHEWASGYHFTSLCAQSWQYRDRREPEVTILYSKLLQCFFVLHSTIESTVYSRPNYSKFRTMTGSNEPSWPLHFTSTNAWDRISFAYDHVHECYQGDMFTCHGNIITNNINLVF